MKIIYHSHFGLNITVVVQSCDELLSYKLSFLSPFSSHLFLMQHWDEG